MQEKVHRQGWLVHLLPDSARMHCLHINCYDMTYPFMRVYFILLQNYVANNLYLLFYLSTAPPKNNNITIDN